MWGEVRGRGLCGRAGPMLSCKPLGGSGSWEQDAARHAASSSTTPDVTRDGCWCVVACKPQLATCDEEFADPREPSDGR